MRADDWPRAVRVAGLHLSAPAWGCDSPSRALCPEESHPLWGHRSTPGGAVPHSCQPQALSSVPHLGRENTQGWETGDQGPASCFSGVTPKAQCPESPRLPREGHSSGTPVIQGGPVPPLWDVYGGQLRTPSGRSPVPGNPSPALRPLRSAPAGADVRARTRDGRRLWRPLCCPPCVLPGGAQHILRAQGQSHESRRPEVRPAYPSPGTHAGR